MSGEDRAHIIEAALGDRWHRCEVCGAEGRQPPPLPCPGPPEEVLADADVRALAEALALVNCGSASLAAHDWPSWVPMAEGLLASDWLAEREARIRAEVLREAADAWLHGEWGNTPRSSDRVADRIGAAQYVGDWLHKRADAESAGRDLAGGER